MPTSSELRTAIRVLETFKEIDPEISLPSMLVLLYAAERDGEPGNQAQVTERLNMTGATASRSISHFLEYKRPRVRGLDLLENTPDHEDRRFKIITLTRKGLDFINRLKEAVNGPSTQR